MRQDERITFELHMTSISSKIGTIDGRGLAR
jgi:hypothetical protein